MFLRAGVLESLGWLEHGFGTRGAELPEKLAGLKQVHSDVIIRAESPGLCGDGDALVTNLEGLAISIRTADCYPVLLADARNRPVAAIHAGWRGTAARIVQKTIEKMAVDFGTTPGDIHAAVGPGIGGCCYKVGPEVACQFGDAVLTRHLRTHLDLATENRKQLEAAGVPPQNIEALGICTFCDAERFFSYRREKETAGRMTSFIRVLRPR